MLIYLNLMLKRISVNSLNFIKNKNFALRNYCIEPKMNLRRISNPIVWMDLEMTGLDIKVDKILELGCLITDKDLNIIAETDPIIIHQPEHVLNSMGDWCIKSHGETGLTTACLESNITVEVAEQILLDFLSKYVEKNQAPLAGNTIYMDRMFLQSYMPKLHNFLHYRVIDVSSFKEMCKRWNPGVFSRAPKKQLKHRSLDDIKESINELKYYKETFLVTK